MGVIERHGEFILVIYRPQYKPVTTRKEKDYAMALRGDKMTHQVTVSASDTHPDFILTAHSSVPHVTGIIATQYKHNYNLSLTERSTSEGYNMNIMSYNIWNYNRDWPARLVLIANTV